MQTCGTFALKQVRVLKGFIFDQLSVVMYARDGFMRRIFFVCRRGGLMVGALDSGSSGPGSSLLWEIFLCSWAKHLTLTMPLHNGV